MKSRVSIDVDEDNQPIIKIEYSPSEDVRDKLVKKFLETFGSGSSWARTHYLYVPDAPVINNTMIIRPIQPHNLEQESNEMMNMFNLLPQVKAPLVLGTVSCSNCGNIIPHTETWHIRNEKIFCNNCLQNEKM